MGTVEVTTTTKAATAVAVEWKASTKAIIATIVRKKEGMVDNKLEAWEADMVRE